MRGVTITPEDELADGVEPLTTEERRWLGALQRVLERCPKRLELITIGDPGLSVVDGLAAIGVDLEDGRASRNGLVLACLDGGPTVHGTS